MTNEDSADPDDTTPDRKNLVRAAFDKAMLIQGAAVERHIRRALQRNRDASPADAV